MKAPLPVALDGGAVVLSHLVKVPAGEPAGTAVGTRKTSAFAIAEPPAALSSRVALTRTESRKPRLPGPFWKPLLGLGETARVVAGRPEGGGTEGRGAGAPHAGG